MLVKMTKHDITYFMDWFLNQSVKIFSFCINTLDSITFWGFSLLDFIITIAIISAMLTVLFTFAPRTAGIAVRDRANRSRKDNDKNES